jgi:hypothetical protein
LAIGATTLEQLALHNGLVNIKIMNSWLASIILRIRLDNLLKPFFYLQSKK